MEGKRVLDMAKDLTTNASARALNAEEQAAKSIYDKCKEMRLTEFKSKEAQAKLQVIAATFGVEGNAKRLKKVYAEGERLAKEQADAELQAKLGAARAVEAKLAEAQRAEAALIGKSKYTAVRPAKSAIGLTAGARGFHSGAEIEINNAAALAAVVDARRLARDAAEVLASGKEILDEKRSAMAAENSGRFVSRAALQQYVASRMLAKDVGAAAQALGFSDLTCKVTKGRNFLVQGSVSAPAVVPIAGKKAILDGSCRVTVKDAKGAVVAEGVFSAAGVGQLDLLYAGFAEGYTFQSLCVSADPALVHPNGSYTCEVSPLCLWAIEL